jgi:enolase-phosphatase E1
VIALDVAGIVLDVEGTTSSVAFVYEVLFPYAREHLRPFLEQHWGDGDLAHARDQMARDAGVASFAQWCTTALPQEQQTFLHAEALCLMDRDAKATGLKELQGLIWRDGYAEGGLHSHVFEDVAPALRRWHGRGLDVRIYSSGSIAAQKLLFAHTIEGDLLPYLRGHYDTATGPKRASASYARIAADMKLPAARLVFVSDVVEELDAARAAGWQTLLMVRPGNAAVQPDHGYREIRDFDAVP